MRKSGRGSRCVVQHLWILLLTVVSLTKTTSLKVYDAAKSLKDNFFGTCQSNLVRFNGTVDAFLNEPLTHENYLVYRLPISHEELTRYHQIPDIYTWTHYNLSVGLQKGKEQAEAWQKPGPMNWAVHAEHPRQNKSNCIAVSKATVERPQKLYRESRQAVTEMYFLRKRNVLIHDTGIVGSRCGYFQLLEACETRFKFIGKRWWNKCKTQLRQAGKTWEDLFDPATSPLFTEEVDANGRVVEPSPSGGAKGAASNVEYVQPFHKRPLVNPVPPIDRYNDTLPWRVIEERNATTAKRPVVQLLPESLSTLCRDQNYISVLTKPWYPHWQYIDGPVLVLTAAWDCNYHHLLLDSLSRIIPILDFIRSSPQMKIHIRRHEIETNSTSYRNAGVALRTRVARFLRIDPQRFISGPVVAKEILIPRAIQCNEPILFPLQMQQLGQTLLQEAEEVMRWELKKAPGLQQAYDRTGVYPAQFPFAVHQPLDTSRHVAHDPKVRPPFSPCLLVVMSLLYLPLWYGVTRSTAHFDPTSVV